MRGDKRCIYLIVKYAEMLVAVTMRNVRVGARHPRQAPQSASARSHGVWQREKVERYVCGRQETERRREEEYHQYLRSQVRETAQTSAAGM
jgi:hypothetical protein